MRKLIFIGFLVFMILGGCSTAPKQGVPSAQLYALVEEQQQINSEINRYQTKIDLFDSSLKADLEEIKRDFNQLQGKMPQQTSNWTIAELIDFQKDQSDLKIRLAIIGEKIKGKEAIQPLRKNLLIRLEKLSKKLSYERGIHIGHTSQQVSISAANQLKKIGGNIANLEIDIQSSVQRINNLQHLANEKQVIDNFERRLNQIQKDLAEFKGNGEGVSTELDKIQQQISRRIASLEVRQKKTDILLAGILPQGVGAPVLPDAKEELEKLRNVLGEIQEQRKQIIEELSHLSTLREAIQLAAESDSSDQQSVLNEKQRLERLRIIMEKELDKLNSKINELQRRIDFINRNMEKPDMPIDVPDVQFIQKSFDRIQQRLDSLYKQVGLINEYARNNKNRLDSPSLDSVERKKLSTEFEKLNSLYEDIKQQLNSYRERMRNIEQKRNSLTNTLNRKPFSEQDKQTALDQRDEIQRQLQELDPVLLKAPKSLREIYQGMQDLFSKAIFASQIATPQKKTHRDALQICRNQKLSLPSRNQLIQQASSAKELADGAEWSTGVNQAEAWAVVKTTGRGGFKAVIVERDRQLNFRCM